MTTHHARALSATRDFDGVRALDAVDLDVGAGQLVGLLGPNGAGKTTLLNLLTGLRRPTSGRVELFGGDPREAGNRRRLGVTPQQTGVPETLRVGEIVDFVGRHYANPAPVGDVLERFGLEGLERRQSGGLSGGQQRRLAVALTFVGRPDLVVLDEPTAGLDVEARHVLWEALREYHREGGTMLLTSHYMEEVEALAQRVVVIGGGRVLADGDPDDIRARVGTHTVGFRAETPPPDLPGITRREHDGNRVRLLTGDSDRLVRDLVASGTEFHDLEVTTASLEEAFMSLTSGDEPTRRES
ncbi:ABC-2 type transport system ATP-binding protein [Saccharopolyspora lacisalsi]|uniref:ABC-2 type transport system ATP-binding protein n=1 Tax=Halosaccharopolyspora lacisalsi TaxID=1000566 RepID=A0A839DP57_9PSEU|nr:ABC transporter ATP-binding protein [Halosaccharopolyspora lacisalsi]MBA8822780.1 ABC-2 type transport system ATP-binding protein [Halosaccharopolyspora lacisalsi]